MGEGSFCTRTLGIRSSSKVILGNVLCFGKMDVVNVVNVVCRPVLRKSGAALRQLRNRPY